MTLELEWHGREAFAAQELRDWDVDGKAAGKTRSAGLLTFATIYGAGHLVRSTILQSVYRLNYTFVAGTIRPPSSLLGASE